MLTGRFPSLLAFLVAVVVASPLPFAVSAAPATPEDDVVAKLEAYKADLIAQLQATVDAGQGTGNAAVDGGQGAVWGASSYAGYWTQGPVDQQQAQLMAKIDAVQALIDALDGNADGLLAGTKDAVAEATAAAESLLDEAPGPAGPAVPFEAPFNLLGGYGGEGGGYGAGYGEGETKTQYGSQYQQPEAFDDFTPLDTDDDATHRAAFTLDRNWALSGSPLTAVADPYPGDTTSITWYYDDAELTGADQSAVDIVDMVSGGLDAVVFRPLTPGLHFLTLKATWSDGAVDRVTSPIYVEDPAITMVPQYAEEASWQPSLVAAVDALASGDAGPAVTSVEETIADAADLLGDRPTLLVISDFLGEWADTPGRLAVAPQQAVETLTALGPVAGLTAAAGLGAINYTGTTTALGHDAPTVGLTLTRTLVEAGLADVVFVAAFDPLTGSLDRAVLRNGLLYALHSGKVDAVLWGLPSAVYQPAVVLNHLRPDLNAVQTPLIAVPAEALLPPAQPTWHGLSLTGHEEVLSVMDSLLELASLLDLEPSGEGNVVELLYANMDQVYPRYQPLIEAVHNDLQFDRFLQDSVLDLAKQGIATVVPSENCVGLEDEYMTVLGMSHIVGTVTVADGTPDAPAPDACKGPDRRAAAHGPGIDLYTDPRPDRTGVLDGLAALGIDPLGVAKDGVPYAPNSLGAALKAAEALGRLHDAQVSPATPWQAQDLVGMVASQSEFHAELPAWAQGVGFVDADGLSLDLPTQFARGSSVVFSPFDLQTGHSFGIVQVVVTGVENVAAWQNAPQEAFSVTGGTEWRFTTDAYGNKVVQDLAGEEFGHLELGMQSMQFNAITPAVGVATLVLDAVPAPVTTFDSPAGETPYVDPPREWLLPGLYTGRTWVSTPNGILQLPINIGVGTIFDVYRFLVPNTPVGDTAVCLGPPFQAIGDLTGLRRTAMELEHLNICIYWTNTDEHGVARFYTPLPLLYTLKSWFNGHFVERGDAIGTNYPHVMETVLMPSPLNLTGISDYVGGFPDSADPVVTTQTNGPGQPVFVDLDLPYPLAYVPVNMSIPVAIAVHWRYRDNMETDHFLPMPDMAIPEFIKLLTGGLVPEPILRRTSDGLAVANGVAEGLLQNSAETLGPILDTAQDRVKGAVPVGSTTMDALLGQPVSKMLPLDLAPDPSACQFGYGHAVSPALEGGLQTAILGDHGGLKPEQAVAQARAGLDDEKWWPDALTMRARPTLDHLLGLTTNVPFCTAVYPFNLPQPNKYPTFITHEFDLYLEATIMVVCVETAMDVVCKVILPGPAGTGNTVVDLETMLLEDAATAVLTANPERLFGMVQGEADAALATVQQVADGVPDAIMALPENLDLATEGHVTLDFQVNGGDGNHGYLHYIAIPLPLLASGILDPALSIISEAGGDPLAVLSGLQVETGIPEADLAIANAGDLLRDSVQDLLRIQPYLEVTDPVFFLNAWWWDDSFFDAPIFPTVLLPRATTTDCDRFWAAKTDPDLYSNPVWPEDPQDPTCKPDDNGDPIILSGTAGTASGDWDLGEDFWWLTRPNINRMHFERGLEYWDPYTLQPDMAALAAAGYPWTQAEFFEVVLQVWDDEEVVDATPNQLHSHGPKDDPTHITVHHQVNYAQHCTERKVFDVRTGEIKNDPETGQHCLEGLLAYEEGNEWLHHDDIWGTGVYDPGLTLSGVPIIYLVLVDGIADTATSATSDLVWHSSVGQPLFGSDVASFTEENLGIDPAALRWWQREDSPTANRTVYSDLYTNATYMLSTHYQTCEELWDFRQMPYWDVYPRWMTDCPWMPGPAAQAAYEDELVIMGGAPRFAPGFVPDDPADPAAGGHYDFIRKRVDKSQDKLTDDDGTPKWSKWSPQIHPVFHPGTYERDEALFQSCGTTLAGWPCGGADAMHQAWLDLAPFVPDVNLVVTDPASGQAIPIKDWVEFALDFYGFDHDGMDQSEAYVTVPLPSNPDGFFGDDPDATEWDRLYRNMALRQLDWDPFNKAPQTGFYSTVQDELTRVAPLLRAYVDGDVDGVKTWFANAGLAAPPWTTAASDGNPFWSDVSGERVPFAEIITPRDTPRGACVGLYWLDRCHKHELEFDGGDLSRFGRAGYFGREAIPPDTYVPQASAYARWNREHLVPATATFEALEVHVHDVPAGACNGPDGHVFYVLAPAGIDLTMDGFSLGAPADGGPAGPNTWWTREGTACVAEPWDDWARFAEFNGRADDPATPEDEALIDRVFAYYATAGVMLADPNDPTGNAVLWESTRVDGQELGCWADERAAHGPREHLELATFDIAFHERFENYHAGFYNHHEPNSGGYDEPVPATRFGAWCVDDEGKMVKALYEREYIPIRLAADSMGGDGTIDRLPPVTTYTGEPGAPADVVVIGVGAQILPKLVTALIADVADIADLQLAAIEVQVNDMAAQNGINLDLRQQEDALFKAVDDTGIPALAVELLELLPPVEQEMTTSSAGSPVVSLVDLSIDPAVSIAQVLVLHSFAFPAGTQGVFVASTDGGESWTFVPASGSPGFIDTSGGAVHTAILDLSAFRGETVRIGSQILGAAWPTATWVVEELIGLPAGTAGFANPATALTGPWDLIYDDTMDPAAIAALAGTPADPARVLLEAPLVIPAGSAFTFDDVQLVGGDCGATACPVEVLGSLTMEGGGIAPGLSLGMPVGIVGEFTARDCEMRGLLAGLFVLGGDVVLERCWLVDMGFSAVASLFGDLTVRDSVIADAGVGIYALGGHVRIEGNLIVRVDRAAGLFDETWGTVRDNVVLHTKQLGFLARSPLGSGDMAFLGNAIEETGTGIGASFAMEDRILALDPLQLGVPVAARDRIQGNEFEWNTLEAIGAGALSAPVAYGNDVTHSNIGARIGWLDPATLNRNDFYSDFYAWREAALRESPPDDGNTWTGIWQIWGLTLAVDATENYFGPGPIEMGRLWPSDVVVHNGQLDVSSPASEATSAPYHVILTAPGYGGGVLPVLQREVDGILQPLGGSDAVSQLTKDATQGTVVGDVLGSGLLPVDEVSITGYTPRAVPIEYDVPAGTTHFLVRGTFYGSGIPIDLDSITTLAGLQETLGPLLPSLPEAGEVVDTQTREIPIATGATSGRFTFTFGGIDQAYVDWEVIGYGKDDGSFVGAADIDPTATKAVRVHNSITWPLLIDATLLVHDLLYDAVAIADGAVGASPTKTFGTGLPVDPAKLAASGVPVSFMADGTLPLHGDPSLLALGFDQDPIRGHEFRYELSTAPGVQVPLGFGADRTLALPDIPEGATLTLLARATDASGLTGPWTGIQMLRDLQAPTFSLSNTCLSGPGSGIAYAASDATPTSGRAAGIGPITLHAAPVDPVTGALIEGATFTFVDDTATGESHSGEWVMPSEAYQPGGVYQVSGIAQDRAGHASEAATTIVTVDIDGPTILVNQELQKLKDMVTAGDIELGEVELLTLPTVPLGDQLLLPVIVNVDEILASCGLESVAVQVFDGLTWTTLYEETITDGTSDLQVPALSVDLAAYQGGHFELKVVATDAAGNPSQWSTGRHLVDLAYPVSFIDPPLPVCTTTAPPPFDWGSDETAVGIPSQLEEVRLTASRSGVPFDTRTSGVLGEAPDFRDRYTLSVNGADIYSVTVTGIDGAGNEHVLASSGMVLDPQAPQITLTDLLGDHEDGAIIGGAELVAGEFLVGAFVDDTLSVTCGLAESVLYYRTGATWTPLDTAPGSPGTATLGASIAPTSVEGQSVDFKVVTTDVAGNPSERFRNDLVFDTLGPIFTDPPSAPGYLGIDGFVVDWVAADARGIASEGWQLLKGNSVLAQGQNGGLVKITDLAQHGASVTLKVTVTDGAGNPTTWSKPLTVDLKAPVIDSVGSAYLDTVAGTVKLDFQASDLGSGIASYGGARLETPPGAATDEVPISIAGSPISEVAQTHGLGGKSVAYRVYATDQAGNVGAAVTSAPVFVDFTPPTLAVTGDDLLGQVRIDSDDLGLPDVGVLDFGQGNDATVLSPGARPASLAFTADAGHQNADVDVTVKVFLAGTEQTGVVESSPGSFSWSYATANPTTDALQRLVFQAIGSNGLVATQSFDFYFPDETTLYSADERPDSEWTFAANGGTATWSGYRLWGARSAYTDSSGSAGPTAEWSTDIPTPRAMVSAYVNLQNKGSGRLDLLSLQDGDTTRSALYVQDSTRTLYVETPSGGESTGVTLGTGWREVRMLLGEDGVDVYLGNTFLKHFDAQPADRGLTGVLMGGKAGRLYVDNIRIQTLDLGLNAFQAHLPLVEVGDLTTSGGGALSVVSGQGKALRFQPAGGTSKAVSPLLNVAADTHVVTHFRVDSAVLGPTEVARLVASPLGASPQEVVVRAYTKSGYLWITDGLDADGAENPALKFPTGVGTTWHRLDLYTVGPVAVASLDQSEHLVVRTSSDGDVLYYTVGNGDGPGAKPVEVDNVRFQTGTDRDHIFLHDLATRGWTEVDAGNTVTVEPTGAGHMDPGRLKVVGNGAANQQRYAAFDKAFLGSKYVLEASFRPTSPLDPPAHQAILSAVTSAGTPKWAVTMGLAGSGWGVFAYGPGDPAPTQISPTYTVDSWKSVRVEVDEATKKIKVWVDEPGTTPSFEKTYTGALSGTNRIAVGDVWTQASPNVMTGAGEALYDDVAAFPR